MRSLLARFRHAAMFFAAGAVAAYLLDPDQGPDRRRSLRGGLDDLRARRAAPRLASTPGPTAPPTDGTPAVNDPEAPATPGELGAAVAYG